MRRNGDFAGFVVRRGMRTIQSSPLPIRPGLTQLVHHAGIVMGGDIINVLELPTRSILASIQVSTQEPTHFSESLKLRIFPPLVASTL